MNKMAEQDLIKLMQETNHPALSLNDVALVSRLDELADRVSNCDTKEIKWFIALPRKLGKVFLTPITIAKASWFEQFPMQWFCTEDKAIALDFVLGYCLAENITIKDLAQLDTPEVCLKTVLDWYNKNDCRYDELTEAIKAMMPSDDQNVCRCITCNRPLLKKNVTEDYGAIIRFLCREYGGTAYHWMYEENLVVIENLINSHVHQSLAEAKQMRGMMTRNGMATPTSAELVTAIKNYREQLNAIRSTWQTKT